MPAILMSVMCAKQIDSLDTLALLGDRERFASSIEWIGKNLRFDIVSKGHYFHHSSFNACTWTFIFIFFQIAIFYLWENVFYVIS